MTEIPLAALKMFTLYLLSSNFRALMVFPSADAYIFILQWIQGNCVQMYRARLILASSLTFLVWFPISSNSVLQIPIVFISLIFFCCFLFTCYFLLLRICE